MVDFSKIADKAKQLASQRGGVDGVKQDAERLRDIAQGDGSAADKLRGAAQALREPHESDAAAAHSDAEGVAEKVPGAPDAATSDPTGGTSGAGVASEIPGTTREGSVDADEASPAEGVAAKIPGAPKPE